MKINYVVLVEINYQIVEVLLMDRDYLRNVKASAAQVSWQVGAKFKDPKISSFLKKLIPSS